MGLLRHLLDFTNDSYKVSHGVIFPGTYDPQDPCITENLVIESLMEALSREGTYYDKVIFTTRCLRYSVFCFAGLGYEIIEKRRKEVGLQLSRI
jgi:hypothetical protein